MMSTVAVSVRASGSDASSKARGRMPMVTSAPGLSRRSASGSGSAISWLPVLHPGLLGAHPVHRRLDQVHLRRADEAGDEQIGRPREDLVRRGDLLDQAGAHDRDAIGHGQRLELIVGDDDGRLVQALQHLLDLAAHGLAQLHVQARERLVEQEALGVADDRAPDRDPLLLALGELTGQAV